MKAINRIPPKRSSAQPVESTPQEFFPPSDADMAVKLETTFNFIRTIPHRWTPDEIARFGQKVGYYAERLFVSYTGIHNPLLGQVRTFPVPLLEWVYADVAPQFGWPAQTLALKNPAEEALKTERTKKNLRTLSDKVKEPQVASALAVVMEWLERDSEDASQLRAL